MARTCALVCQMTDAQTGCLDVNVSEARVLEETATPRINGSRGTLHVGEQGALNISPEQSVRCGLVAGAEFEAHELPEGLYLKRLDVALHKVYVEPTSACNLNCRTCVRRTWDEPMGTMSMRTYDALIEGLRNVPSLRTMAFWGFGEPLMHPHIVEMVAAAKKLGARAVMITNGLLLTEDLARGLMDAGLDSLVISVDGVSAQSYSDVRSGGDLSLVSENVARLLAIRRARDGRTPEIGLEFVAMRSNVTQLAQLDRLARQYEASFVVITNVLPYAEDMKDEILYGMMAGRSYPAGRTFVTPQVILPRMDLRREVLEPSMELVSRSGYAEPPASLVNGTAGHCRFVNEGAVAVGWDGGVSPCIALMHSYSCYVLRREKQIRRSTLGNVADTSIADLWRIPAYVAFRDRVQRFDFSP